MFTISMKSDLQMACLCYKVKQGQEKVLSHETVLFVTANLRDVMKVINNNEDN